MGAASDLYCTFCSLISEFRVVWECLMFHELWVKVMCHLTEVAEVP